MRLNQSFQGKKRRKIRKGELLEIAARIGLDFINAGYIKAEIEFRIARHGHCEDCGQPFTADDGPEYDHKIPNATLEEDDEIDWQVLHETCHAIKTKGDVKDIARAKRRRGETGQYARRQRRKERGKRPLIQPAPFDKPPPGYKHRWAKRKVGQ